MRAFGAHLNDQGHSCLDQIIRSGNVNFSHYVKVRMIATFLIGPSTVEVCWITQNP